MNEFDDRPPSYDEIVEMLNAPPPSYNQLFNTVSTMTTPTAQPLEEPFSPNIFSTRSIKFEWHSADNIGGIIGKC